MKRDIIKVLNFKIPLCEKTTNFFKVVKFYSLLYFVYIMLFFFLSRCFYCFLFFFTFAHMQQSRMKVFPVVVTFVSKYYQQKMGCNRRMMDPNVKATAKRRIKKSFYFLNEKKKKRRTETIQPSVNCTSLTFEHMKIRKNTNTQYVDRKNQHLFNELFKF